jgi:hypothetical protein
MFIKLLTQRMIRDPQDRQAPFSQERLQPDSSRSAGWFQRLAWKLVKSPFWSSHTRDEFHPLEREAFVPDGHLALLLRNGQPTRWLPPGRHQLDPAKAKVEVRLLSAEVLGEGHSTSLQDALDLPYERALLFVDGVQVAFVKPATRIEQPLRERRDSSLRRVAQPPQEQHSAHLAAADGEEEAIQGFSFV